MKVIVQKATGLARYTFADTDNVVVLDDKLISPKGIDVALDSTNTVVYMGCENVPADFATNKYFFDGETWTLNPGYRSREQKAKDAWDADVAAKKIPKHRN